MTNQEFSTPRLWIATTLRRAMTAEGFGFAIVLILILILIPLPHPEPVEGWATGAVLKPSPFDRLRMRLWEI